MAIDAASLIASLHHDGARLDLKTIDLCFLAALYGRENDGTLTSIDDSTMVDLFTQVCELVEPGSENVRNRATHAIQRLRDQRLLARIDGAGLVRPGDFNLTPLATHIVESFLHDSTDVLTPESLGLLTKQLIASLSAIKRAAQDAVTTDEWHSAVASPLRITIKDLVTGIDRRQRGLDHQQQEVRTRISKRLEIEWFAAIGHCEALLDETASTLAELKTILLQDTHRMRSFLQDIEQLAHDADQPQAEETARRVAERIDQVAAWGNDRQEVWSHYYQNTHRFLRDVVRLDPSRALSERLRDQLAGWIDDPFFLNVTETKPMRVLREVETRIDRPPVARSSRNREVNLEPVSTDPDPRDLEALVTTALTHTPDTLATVVREVLPQLPEERQYRAIGEIAAQIARHAASRPGETRPWVHVPCDFEIEDWPLNNDNTP